MNRPHIDAAITLVVLLLTMCSASILQAGGCLHGKKSCKTTCCPRCEHTCHLDAEQVEAEKKCFEVETKMICIPRVVFPWQKKSTNCLGCSSCVGARCSACVHNGAKIRKIKVLKTKKYTCPECQYHWTPEDQSSCCDGGCQGRDDAGDPWASDPWVGGIDGEAVSHDESGFWHANYGDIPPIELSLGSVEVQPIP